MNFTLPWSASKAPTNTLEDVKQQIGQKIERLGDVASQLGRDVAQSAGNVGQDATEQASNIASVARDIGAQAAEAAKDLPTSASAIAQQALGGVSQIGRELRKVRVTREPVKADNKPDVRAGIALLGGFGGGLALMYFFDPGEGRRRRNLLRDQLMKWLRMGREAATGRATDLRNRTTGLAHEARKAIPSGSGTPEHDEDMLAETRYGEFESGLPGNGSTSSSDQYTGRAIPIEGGNEEPITSEIR